GTPGAPSTRRCSGRRKAATARRVSTGRFPAPGRARRIPGQLPPSRPPPKASPAWSRPAPSPARCSRTRRTANRDILRANDAPPAASSQGSRLFPSVVFHRESGSGLDLLLFEHKALALIPAPGLVVFADAAQPDFIRQAFARKTEQPPAEAPALIFRR